MGLTAAMSAPSATANDPPTVIDRPAFAEDRSLACLGGDAPACNLRIYQVMVESFANGGGAGYGAGYGPSAHRGDLKGVTLALDYIASLGVNALWLTPIFDSHSGAPQMRVNGPHPADLKLDATGYFARDYFKVDPRFGTLQDLRALVDAAHARGLYVFLDGVFGHHKGDVVASPSGKRPVDSTNPADYPGNPKDYPGRVVDYRHPDSLAFFQEVATYWIEAVGIDGWRFDQAFQVPPQAWAQIRRVVEETCAARQARGERWGTLCYMVGEVWDRADRIRASAYGDDRVRALDSAFDFPVRYALVQVLGGEEHAKNRLPATTLLDDWALGAHRTYPERAMPNLMLGNHDLVRFGDLLQRHKVADIADEAYWTRHALAFKFMTAWSGPITLYYGEELGQEHPNFAEQVIDNCAEFGLCDDHVSRTDGLVPGLTIAAEALDPRALALKDLVARLMRLRADEQALWAGVRQHVHADRETFVVLKSRGARRILFVMNVGEAPRTLAFAPAALGGGATKLRDLETGEILSATDVQGRLLAPLAGLEGRFLAVE